MKKVCIWVGEHAVFFDLVEEFTYESILRQGELFKQDFDGTDHVRMNENAELILGGGR